MTSVARLRPAFALGLMLLCLGCAGHTRNACVSLGAGAGCRSVMRHWIDRQFGAPPAEVYALEGGELRRIFGVGAFHAIVGVSFLRRPDGHAEVRVDFARPRVIYVSQPEPISTPIPEKLWLRAVAATSDLAEIEWRPGRPPEPGDIIVCADGALWGVEVTARPGGPVQRRIGNSCDDKRLPKVADALIALARSAFPACRALRPRYDVEQYGLMDCGMLAGEKMAAAEALNRFSDSPLDDFDRRGTRDFEPFLAEPIILEWDGARSSGHEAVAATMARLFASAPNSRLLIDRVTGESADRVRMTGWAVGYVDDPMGRSTRRIAPWTQYWQRSGDEAFRLARMEIGGWRPEPHGR